MVRSFDFTFRLQHTATHCNTPQHTATHCNTLQHTATHLNTLLVRYFHFIFHFLCIYIKSWKLIFVPYIRSRALCSNIKRYVLLCLLYIRSWRSIYQNSVFVFHIIEVEQKGQPTFDIHISGVGFALCCIH